MTISEFLEKSHYSEPYLGKGVSQKLVSKLISNMDVSPGKVEFIGVMKKEYNMFSEHYILYRFPKDSEELGNYLRALGTMISRIPVPLDGEISSIGINEIDASKSDGYYVMIYALS